MLRIFSLLLCNQLLLFVASSLASHPCTAYFHGSNRTSTSFPLHKQAERDASVHATVYFLNSGILNFKILLSLILSAQRHQNDELTFISKNFFKTGQAASASQPVVAPLYYL